MLRSHSPCWFVAFLAPVAVAIFLSSSASAQRPPPIPPPPPRAIATDDPPPQPITIEAPQAHEARVLEQVRIDIRAVSPSTAPLTYSIIGAPPGSTLVPLGSYAELRWTPQDSDVGAHDVTITVSDGTRTASHEMTILVVDEWKTFFMPGLQYSGYGPNTSSKWGSFQGVSAEFLLYAWIARNDNHGPSHGRLYVNLDVLGSTRTGIGSAFSPTMGIDLSIERNPARRFLLPYFGFETGGMFQKDMGSIGIVTPFAGVHVFSSPNLFVNLSAGYVLPLDAQQFDELRGWRIKFGFDFSLW